MKSKTREITKSKSCALLGNIPAFLLVEGKTHTYVFNDQVRNPFAVIAFDRHRYAWIAHNYWTVDLYALLISRNITEGMVGKENLFHYILYLLYFRHFIFIILLLFYILHTVNYLSEYLYTSFSVLMTQKIFFSVIGMVSDIHFSSILCHN